jgi:hypothetical protein
MSSNATGSDGGSSAAAASHTLTNAQAPKLRNANSESYAMWRPDMEVWLERIGAERVHTRVMLPTAWIALAQQVERSTRRCSSSL